jgi:hypothetical protein
LDTLLAATKVSERAACLVEILAVRKAALMAGKKAVKLVVQMVDKWAAWMVDLKVLMLARSKVHEMAV